MARITIAAYGSRGDLTPLTDVGIRLQQRGHDVVMTATPDLVDEISACGLNVRPIDIEIGDPGAPVENPLKSAMQLVLPKGMSQLGRKLLTALDDIPADVLLLSPFAEFAGHPLAEARNIPSIGVRLQPISTTAAFPPSLLGAWSAGAVLNRSAGRLATATLDRLYRKTVAGFRDQLGLPQRSQRSLRRQRTESEWPILHGFSPSVLHRPDDWRPGLDVVGYWWPQRAADWKPPTELAKFLDHGSPPVYFGLGSLMLSTDESARISDLVRDAFCSLGVRGVIQAGGAGLEVLDHNNITIEAVPHDWLFDRVAAVVHSCGAGTVAAGLRAGLPAVAVPSPGGDQPFWARRLTELGITPKAIPRPKLTADRLVHALDAALHDPSHRVNAQQLAADIAEEDGAAAVVAAVEKLVRT